MRRPPFHRNNVHSSGCRYSDAASSTDWPLVWSVMPVVAADRAPPPGAAAHVRLRSPPPFAAVVAHLKRVSIKQQLIANNPLQPGCTALV